jgi:hypothetical protein
VAARQWQEIAEDAEEIAVQAREVRAQGPVRRFGRRRRRFIDNDGRELGSSDEEFPNYLRDRVLRRRLGDFELVD